MQGTDDPFYADHAARIFMKRPQRIEPQILLGAGDAPVRVSVAVPTSPLSTWSALTDPRHLGQWFGTLRGEFREGAHVQFDFEDSDFFDVHAASAALLRDPGLRPCGGLGTS